jgi:serine protease Do
MRRSLTVAVMAAATLLAGGATANASESPSPSTSPSASSGATAPTELERVSAYTQPSVVYIDITWTGYVFDTFNKLYLNNEKPFQLSFQCTGYVVNPNGYIATAGHCVDPAEVIPSFKVKAAEWALGNGYYQATDLTLEDVLGFNDYKVENADGKAKPDLKVTTAWSVSAGGVETGKALPARVVKWRSFDQGDGAMLKVEATNLNALPLSETDIEIGTEVVAIGYPGSVDLVADATFTPSYKEGAISSKKTVSNGLLTVYEISAAVSGGMSGGPTVNLKGEVIGFNSFGINSDIETQQFNFVRPVGTVRELLGDAGAAPELSQDSQDYRAGLDAFFAGDKTTAVEKLSSVVDNQPTNELASEYLEKSENLPDPPKAEATDEGGNMGLIIGIVVGVVVLLAILAAVLLMLSKRKKGGSSAPSSHAYTGPPPASSGYPQQTGSATAPGGSSTAVLAPPAPASGQSQQSASPAAPPAASPTAPPPPAPATAPQQAQTEIVDETTFCQNCGTKGEPGQKFCKHCGTAL